MIKPLLCIRRRSKYMTEVNTLSFFNHFSRLRSYRSKLCETENLKFHTGAFNRKKIIKIKSFFKIFTSELLSQR